MNKLIVTLILSISAISFIGCSSENQSSDVTFKTQPGEEVLATRKFDGLEEMEFSIPCDEKQMVGFRTKLTEDQRTQMQETAKRSGNFDDNFSGTVDQLPSGNGIGGMDGVEIGMTPKDGVIKFRFKNLLKDSHTFQVYTRDVPSDFATVSYQ